MQDVTDNEFYESDEPVANIKRAFERSSRRGLTGRGLPGSGQIVTPFQTLGGFNAVSSYSPVTINVVQGAATH